MGATSKHYGDVYRWIIKVIESCETPEQDKTARKLIGLYITDLQKNKNIEFEMVMDIQRNLTCAIDGITFSRLEKKLQNGN